ncbi:MAG: MarR family transcriptional regulator [Blautia sp.]|nr:MarR family transcriptional regulator [Blautia sp.]MBS7174530.1 MarR family transcriptional regulator [Blautia sp.]NSG68054.1 MarR family transcriptional regulator [Blautia caecimuris]
MFMQLNRAYAAKCFSQMTALGIHPGQIPILLLLAKRVEMSQREIAEELCVKPPTVNVMVQRMEKAGLIGRRHDEKDQRITRIFLTDQGYEMKKKVAEQIELNERYAFMGFSDAEKCLFRRFMEQIITNISCIPEEKTENLQEKERLTSD